MTCLYGREGCGKSCLLRQAVGALAFGVDWLTLADCDVADVLWVGREETAGQLKSGFIDAVGDVPDGIRYANSQDVDEPDVLRRLGDKLRPAVVVFDPLADCLLRGVDVRSYSAVRDAVVEWQAALGNAAGGGACITLTGSESRLDATLWANSSAVWRCRASCRSWWAWCGRGNSRRIGGGIWW